MPTNRTPAKWGLWSLLLAAAGACGTESPVPTVQIWDSAGVTVVESLAPRWGGESLWRVESTPVLDLSAAGTGVEYEFYRLRDATRLSDGTLAVLSRGSTDLRFYSSVGVFETSVGREGEGPGEFLRPESVDRYRGDSLVVFDYWSRRLTIIDPHRQVSRTATFGTRSTDGLYPLGDGRFVLSINGLTVEEAGMGRVRIPQPLVLADASGVLTDTIVVAPGFETWVFEGGSAGPPLRRQSSTAVASGFVFTADGEGVQYSVYSLDGELERLVRIPDFPLEAPDHVRDSIRDYLLQNEGPGQRDLVREMAASVPMTLPGIVDLQVDSQGHVWAAEYFARQVTGVPRSWLVFDPEGIWLGRVLLPADFDPYEIGADYVLGRRRDSLNVETIRLLRLLRS